MQQTETKNPTVTTLLPSTPEAERQSDRSHDMNATVMSDWAVPLRNQLVNFILVKYSRAPHFEKARRNPYDVFIVARLPKLSDDFLWKTSGQNIKSHDFVAWIDTLPIYFKSRISSSDIPVHIIAYCHN